MDISLNPRIRIFGVATGIACTLFAAGEVLANLVNLCPGLARGDRLAVIGMGATALAVLLVGMSNSLLMREAFDDDFRDGGKIGRAGFVLLLLGQALDWYLFLSPETSAERPSPAFSVGVRALTAVGWLLLLRAALRMGRNLRPWAARCAIAAPAVAMLHAAVPSGVAPVAVAAVYAAAMLAGAAGVVSVLRARS